VADSGYVPADPVSAGIALHDGVDHLWLDCAADTGGDFQLGQSAGAARPVCAGLECAAVKADPSGYPFAGRVGPFPDGVIFIAAGGQQAVGLSVGHGRHGVDLVVSLVEMFGINRVFFRLAASFVVA